MRYYWERRHTLIKKIEDILNNEYYPIKFKLLKPDIRVGRCDYEIIAQAKVEVKPTNENWQTRKIESVLKLPFQPSKSLARAFAREIFVKVNTMFNTMKITKKVMRPTKEGIKLEKTVTELKYEDWRFVNG